MIKYDPMLRQALSKKWVILLLSLVAVGVMVLLSTSLNNVELQPGYSLPFEESHRVENNIGSAVQNYQKIPLWKQVLFWSLLVLFFILAFLMLPPELRKRLIRSLINVFSTAFLLLYLFKKGIIDPARFEENGGAGAVAPQPEGSGDVLVIEPFAPPVVSPWVTYFLALGILLALLLIGWFLFRLWKRLSVPETIPTKPLNEFASIARSSLDDLNAGDNWGDVIVSCYARMGDAIHRNRGLSRKRAMTPAEFAHRLERAGLPGAPVQRLTHLFEAVRYGKHASGENEINEAVSCLTEILDYCGETT